MKTLLFKWVWNRMTGMIHLYCGTQTYNFWRKSCGTAFSVIKVNKAKKGHTQKKPPEMYHKSGPYDSWAILGALCLVWETDKI